MIQKAIEKIDEEIKQGGIMEKSLGEYVKSELLTSDSNAMKILAPNTDLETFVERLWKVADSVRISNKVKTPNEMGKNAIAAVKGIKPEKVADEFAIIEKIGVLCVMASNKHNRVCLSSEIVIPLLHIYYGIPLTPVSEKGPAPKRRRFNTVSLD